MRKETNPARIKAIEILKKYGILVPFDDNVELYHGRARNIDDQSQTEWKVEANFDNGGNATGNYNLNKISALSTGNYGVARDFAHARTRKGQTAEVHRIVSSDSDALIFDNTVRIWKLEDDEQKEIIDAFKVLTNSFTISQLDPVEFEDRENYKVVMDFFKKDINTNHKFFTEEDLEEKYEIFKKENPNISYDLFYDIGSAVNTRFIIYQDPGDIIGCYINKVIPTILVNGEHIVINKEYVASWLYNNNIIGYNTLVTSATLDEDIENCMFFDTERINTEKVIGNRLALMMSRFDDFTRLLGDYCDDNEMIEKLTFSSPKETIEYIKSIDPYYASLFEGSTHTWEGYTIGEHTEAVLRVFEDSFLNDVPTQLVPFIKLAIIAHDIGKSTTTDRTKQKSATDEIAQILFKDMGIDPKASTIIRYIIGDSQTLTSAYYIGKKSSAKVELFNNCNKLISEVFGIESTKEIDTGLGLVCMLLQNCDSGAYTRFATIRDEKTGVYYHGGSDKFTSSFTSTQYPGRSKIRLTSPPNPIKDTAGSISPSNKDNSNTK